MQNQQQQQIIPTQRIGGGAIAPHDNLVAVAAVYQPRSGRDDLNATPLPNPRDNSGLKILGMLVGGFLLMFAIYLIRSGSDMAKQNQELQTQLATEQARRRAIATCIEQFSN